MRILVTGVGGNIGTGIVPMLCEAGHDLVLSDLNPLPPELEELGLPFHQLDIQTGIGLDRAADGCDLVLHLPAWHGIHWRAKTETDFWRLNVDGTFYAFQAAKAVGIKRFVFLSSQAWHGHYDKYGFTKRVGEELCEYHRHQNGINYVAIRPADLTPWGDDWVNRYGARLLYGGVDRNDVLDAIVAAVNHLTPEREKEGLIIDAMRPNAFTLEQIENWEADPIGTCEAIFPGYKDLVTKYGLRIERKPGFVNHYLGWEEAGFAAKRHFGTFLAELRRLDTEIGEEAIRAIRCPY